MNKNKKSRDMSVIMGAAFLMATSAIGPGFLTQTANFVDGLGANFGFVILISLIFSLIAQLNVWRIVAVANLRAQDIANKTLPGSGHLLAALVAIGGLVFNIGNVGGAGLGLNVLFGLNVKVGAALSGLLALFIFSSPRAGNFMDRITQVLGTIMILLIAFVAIRTQPPVGEAIQRTVMPSEITFLPIVTLVGGTVGGYIIFSGAHRLLDAGIHGEDRLDEVNSSAGTGMIVAAIVRVLLFLAVLGVVSKGISLDKSNPAADAFLQGSGNIGYRIFGVVMWAASISSVIGCGYTSISFLTSMSNNIKENQNRWVMIFIIVTTLMSMTVGQPAALLVIAGSVNGLILPISLGIMLLASRNKNIIGDYKHSQLLFYAGILVVIVTAYMGIRSLSGLSALFV